MRAERYSSLVQLLAARLTLKSQQDVVRSELLAAMQQIQAKSWPWAFKKFSVMTFEPLTETQTFTWTAGDRHITASGALSDLTYAHTGRMVYIGESWYRIVEVGRVSNATVVLDAELEDTVTDPTTLTFYRADFALKTSKVREIRFRGGNLTILSSWEPAIGSLNRGERSSSTVGTPTSYSCDGSFRIEPPLFPPTVPTFTAAAFDAGVYYYAWSFYDQESKSESPLGPILKYTAAANEQPNVQYANSGNVAEDNTSYTMRLWRSERNPPRDSPPMFLIDERSPSTTVTIVDTLKSLVGLPRWDDSTQILVSLYPIPSVSRVLDIECTKLIVSPPHDDDMWPMGENGELDQLLVLYLARLHAPDAAAAHDGLIRFNRQLDYVLSKSTPAANHASGDWNTRSQAQGAASEYHPFEIPTLSRRRR